MESITETDNELKLIDVVLFVKKSGLLIFTVTLISTILGIAYSFTLPKLYESNIVLLPEYGSVKKNAFSSLLSNNLLGEGAEKLSPELYPKILESSLLGIYLLEQPVTNMNNKKYSSLEEYLIEIRSPSFINKFLPSNTESDIKELPKVPNVLSMTQAEESTVKQALGLIKGEIDLKNGVISIVANTQDPVVSAILVEASRNFLINYVEEYRSSKASDNSKTLLQQMKEAKSKLRSAEIALSSYRDRNRNPFLNTAKIEEQRLQSEYVLTESLYEDLSRKYEQAKLKITEEKPVFKIIEPAKISMNKSSPKRVRIGLISGFLGGFICLLYIIFIKENILGQAYQRAYFK